MYGLNQWISRWRHNLGAGLSLNIRALPFLETLSNQYPTSNLQIKGSWGRARRRSYRSGDVPNHLRFTPESSIAELDCYVGYVPKSDIEDVLAMAAPSEPCRTIETLKRLNTKLRM